MLLSELILHPYTSRFYLERYVNDGSPSGFSTINTTKHPTIPFELNPFFSPLICIADKSYFKEFGVIPKILFQELTDEKNWILVHPDMKTHPFFDNPKFLLTEVKEFKVVPTASGRTVQIYQKLNDDYIKLHYSGILGRVSRELPFIKAVAGPEVSTQIIKGINEGIVDNKLTILPETGARVLVNEHNEEWGMVWRENKPYRLSPEDSRFLFPSFSFFSTDRINNYHFPLFKQIIDYYKFPPKEYLLEVIIFPLIKAYFSLINNLGLQAELNSQNLLFSFNSDFSNCHFVLRDLESVDKDLTLMRMKNISFNSKCYPFKFIEETQYNYQIKHSFMYDFKLGECIFEPILEKLEKFYSIKKQTLYTEIRNYATRYIKELPINFFPKNKWYAFDKVIVDQSKPERPYIEHDSPKFR